MREILFRGKRLDNGEWIEGAFVKKLDPLIGTPSYFIVGQGTSMGMLDPLCTWYIVDPATLGQYTGLTDKNGRKIFEGDVVEFEDTGEDGYEYSEGFDYRNRAVVVWGNGRWELDKFASDNSGVADDMMHDHDDFISVFQYQSWIIGNIHDNPELAGGDEDAAD